MGVLCHKMDERRLPKQVLYGQLLDSPRLHGGQKLRFKDTLRHNLQKIFCKDY